MAKVIVDTYKLDGDEPAFETSRVIDWSKGGHRIWLTKHTWWCLRNGRGVQIKMQPT